MVVSIYCLCPINGHVFGRAALFWSTSEGLKIKLDVNFVENSRVYILALNLQVMRHECYGRHHDRGEWPS